MLTYIVCHHCFTSITFKTNITSKYKILERLPYYSHKKVKTNKPLFGELKILIFCRKAKKKKKFNMNQ